MAITPLTWPGSECSGGNCPTVYVDDEATDTVIIQGYRLDPASADQLGVMPAGETALRFPRRLLTEAYEALAAPRDDDAR